MAARNCTGCGAEMGQSDSYCRICGRIQLPRSRRPSEGERIGVGKMVLWVIVALAILTLLAWAIEKLKGI